MLKIQNISKTYDGQVYAVKNLSLEIQAGEIFGFLGMNGAGKSTTLKVITDQLSPTEGRVELGGYDLATQPLEVKRQFYFVSDNPNLFLKMKGLDYLKFIANIYQVPRENLQERLLTIAESFDMKNALPNTIESYSHGMRQKIYIIASLLVRPKLWILDEPLTGLDPKSVFNLKNYMRQAKAEGRSVLFSTHILDVAEGLCDRLAVIHKGELLYCGGLEEMKAHFAQSGSLEDLFLEITKE